MYEQSAIIILTIVFSINVQIIPVSAIYFSFMPNKTSEHEDSTCTYSVLIVKKDIHNICSCFGIAMIVFFTVASGILDTVG